MTAAVSRWIVMLTIAGIALPSPPPAAKVVPFSQTFYGSVRSDPYHWMEAGGPDLRAYVGAQSAYATALLARNPGRAAMRKTIADAFASAGSAAIADGVMRIGSRVFFMRDAPGSNVPSIFVRDGERPASLVVRAASLHGGSVVGWFVPSPDGTKIAYGATQSSEYVVIHVCNADGTHDVPQAIEPSVIPYVVWHGERAFYYPAVRASAADRTETSYLHVLNAAKGSDVAITGFGARGPMGSATARDLFAQYAVLDGDATLATIQHDVVSNLAVFVAPYRDSVTASGPWRRVFSFDDRVVAAVLAGQYVYALSDRGGARRSIVIRDRSSGRTLKTIAADAGFREFIFANRTGCYVAERIGAAMRLERYGLTGTALGTIALPRSNALAGFTGNAQTDSFAVESVTFGDPGHWYEITGAQASVHSMRVNGPIPRIYKNLRSRDGFAVSIDGTKIPYTVIYRAGERRDGRRPTVVIGYGAYGYDIEPPVPPFMVALVERGIVLVLAHVRGGGELGEAWHRAGKGPTKQHSIDDFVACARAAIAAGWTSHAKLAGYGGSAGGITIGGALTQEPALFAAALSEVGFNDMVDMENMPNGPGNVPEFGSVKTRAGFHDLLAMSAYDHVVPASYPAVILTTGLNDQRTAPWQVAKMAARLQASSTSGKPVLLRADLQGHGVISDPSAQIDEYTDEFTFLLWQLGEPGFAMPLA